MDHDDVLDPEALAELAEVIVAEDDVDVIYSDEDKLDELDRPYMPHFKPDWDPDLLLAYPYLGHVTAIRRELLNRIGGFRSDFDGSQDYDVMLQVDRAGSKHRAHTQGAVPLAGGGRLRCRGHRRQAVGPSGQPACPRGHRWCVEV